MTREELDHIYCGWSGSLHKWVAQYLGAPINVEYDPNKWEIRLWPGDLEMVFGTSGVFHVERPAGTAAMDLPPEGSTQEEVDEAFKRLCLIAAALLNIDLGKAKLSNGPAPSRTLPAPDPADGKPKRPRLGKRKRPGA